MLAASTLPLGDVNCAHDQPTCCTLIANITMLWLLFVVVLCSMHVMMGIMMMIPHRPAYYMHFHDGDGHADFDGDDTAHNDADH